MDRLRPQNMRTALEHGVSLDVALPSTSAIVCPERRLIGADYVRPYDEQFAHPAAGGEVVAIWRQTYSVSTALPPEVWAEGRFLPDGHTVSVSDMYFVAHFLCIVKAP